MYEVFTAVFSRQGPQGSYINCEAPCYFDPGSHENLLFTDRRNASLAAVQLERDGVEVLAPRGPFSLMSRKDFYTESYPYEHPLDLMDALEIEAAAGSAGI